MTYDPQADQPTSLPEAIIYADRYYHDNGFGAFTHGFALARNEEIPDEAIRGSGSYAERLTAWAKTQLRSPNEQFTDGAGAKVILAYFYQHYSLFVVPFATLDEAVDFLVYAEDDESLSIAHIERPDGSLILTPNEIRNIFARRKPPRPAAPYPRFTHRSEVTSLTGDRAVLNHYTSKTKATADVAHFVKTTGINPDRVKIVKQ